MLSAFGITDFVTYLLGTIAIILLPGPNSMYCLYVAGSQGVKQGYITVVAIIIGDTILMTTAVLGAATVLKASATFFFIFKILGGIYLTYLGISLLIAAYTGFTTKISVNEYLDARIKVDSKHSIKNKKQLNSLIEVEPQDFNMIKESITNNLTDLPKKEKRVFIKALLLSLSNPKAILFFLSFFIQFVDPNYHTPAISFTLLGVTLQLVSILYLSMLIFTGHSLASFFKHHLKIAATGHALVGLLFISFAVTLWRAET